MSQLAPSRATRQPLQFQMSTMHDYLMSFLVTSLFLPLLIKTTTTFATCLVKLLTFMFIFAFTAAAMMARAISLLQNHSIYQGRSFRKPVFLANFWLLL